MKVQKEPAATGLAVAGLVPAAKGKLEIRQVWAHNLVSEFANIRAVADHFPYVSMDTEFPGVIHRPSKHHALLTPPERYAALKANVDALDLIQVGLAFAASPGAPPAFAFEINLREFDPRVCAHAPDSVALLAAHGLDFAAHRRHGACARDFAALLMSSGLVCAGNDGLTWVTFHSAYDFGYLVKLLVGRKLPRTLPEFLGLVRVFFGDDVYDLRHVMTRCGGLYGGLDRVAASLGVEREAGRAHQAGSDSALTWDTFCRVREVYFAKEGVRSFAGVIFGLELELDTMAASQTITKCGAAPVVNNNMLDLDLATMAPNQTTTKWVAAPIVNNNNIKLVNKKVSNNNNNKLADSTFVYNKISNKFVNNNNNNSNKFVNKNNGGNRCAAVAGNGNRKSRKVAPQVQAVAVSALR